MTFIDKYFAGDYSFFDIPVEEQKNFLARLGKANDDYDRSFKQYKCQMFFWKRYKVMVLNFVSICVFPFLFIYYVIKGLTLKKQENLDAIGRLKPEYDFVPDSLMKEFEIDRTHWNDSYGLYWHDIHFIVVFWLRYLLHPFFVLKVSLKIFQYSSLIYRFTPRALIVHDEFSFTSSVLTLFCGKHQVEHINVMHGEKLFYIRDSYFRYDRCYVWDQHYIDLFVSMNADNSHFITELPISMSFDKQEYYDVEKHADYKYYLAMYDENELKSIVASFAGIKEQGKSVRFRPHPNYSDVELLKRYVAEEEIEMPTVDIKTSIASADVVVSSYSTVLNQAYFNGIKVVLDDITYAEEYAKLKSLRYILSNKNITRLSEII